VDPFHERLARVGLSALTDYGFALAGGYAVQAHGILDRPSEDIDLFTTLASEGRFSEAVRVAVAAFAADGLAVEVLVENPGFARLLVIDASADRSSKVELGIDWRQHPPTTLAIGPVLAKDDAVANKVNALYSRGQARDYVDVDAALTTGAYSRERLLTLAREHDPGFEPALFAQALRAARRLPMAEFRQYGLDGPATTALLARLSTWAEAIDGQP
jgi:hypothetical protein